MKKQLLTALTAVMLLLIPTLNFAQAPPLGTAAGFVLFSTNGAVSNSGISQLTGNVGTNIGSSTNFGNVNGVMHDQDGVSGQCATDLLKAYDSLNVAIPTFFPSSALGGNTLIAGVYAISGAATLNGVLTLDANNISSAVFIFQISGPLSTNANSKIKLINGALACNVFWKVEGLVSMASGTSMKGTVIANNAAINMNTGDTLEGRALSTAGAVSVDGVLAYTPIGCGSPIHMGPIAPVLNSTACYALFTSTGELTNIGITHITGDIGTNNGLTTGYNPLLIIGTIHPTDGSTAQCKTDLDTLYKYLNTLPSDIELLYPAQFGRSLVLTPHTYIMKAAVTFTDTLYLNAEGSSNAIFVIQVNGAFETSTFSKVKLINGTQAKNVFWKIDGAVHISNNSVFNGSIVSQGAIKLDTGVVFNGSAYTVVGSLKTFEMSAFATSLPSNCLTVGLPTIDAANMTLTVTIYPNPFSASTTIMINDISQIKNCELRIYDILGSEVMNTKITKQLMTLNTNKLSSGIYYYKLISNNKIIQSGKLISQ